MPFGCPIVDLGWWMIGGMAVLFSVLWCIALYYDGPTFVPDYFNGRRDIEDQYDHNEAVIRAENAWFCHRFYYATFWLMAVVLSTFLLWSVVVMILLVATARNHPCSH